MHENKCANPPPLGVGDAQGSWLLGPHAGCGLLTSSGLKTLSIQRLSPMSAPASAGTSPTHARQDSKRDLLPPAPSFRTNDPGGVLTQGHWATALRLLLGGRELNFSGPHVEEGGLMESIAGAPGKQSPAGVGDPMIQTHLQGKWPPCLDWDVLADTGP